VISRSATLTRRACGSTVNAPIRTTGCGTTERVLRRSTASIRACNSVMPNGLTT
jgi:hypothetical protein